jgi:hypothetical protein
MAGARGLALGLVLGLLSRGLQVLHLGFELGEARVLGFRRGLRLFLVRRRGRSLHVGDRLGGGLLASCSAVTGVVERLHGGAHGFANRRGDFFLGHFEISGRSGQ